MPAACEIFADANTGKFHFTSNRAEGGALDVRRLLKKACENFQNRRKLQKNVGRGLAPAVSLTEIMSSERLRRFFFGTTGAKKKLCKKKAPFGGVSPPAGGDQGSAFGNRKPLKRLDLNFKKAKGGSPSHFFANFSSG